MKTVFDEWLLLSLPRLVRPGLLLHRLVQRIIPRSSYVQKSAWKTSVGSMEELRSLKAQVDKALIEEENGTPGAHEGLLRSIDQLQVAALGPTDYLLRLRYAVRV